MTWGPITEDQIHTPILNRKAFQSHVKWPQTHCMAEVVDSRLNFQEQLLQLLPRMGGGHPIAAAMATIQKHLGSSHPFGTCLVTKLLHLRLAAELCYPCSSLQQLNEWVTPWSWGAEWGGPGDLPNRKLMPSSLCLAAGTAEVVEVQPLASDWPNPSLMGLWLRGGQPRGGLTVEADVGGDNVGITYLEGRNHWCFICIRQ